MSSDNPFRDLPNANPYAPPSPRAGAPTPENPLLVPAGILLILALLMLLLLIATIPTHIAHIRGIDMSTPTAGGDLIGYLLPLILWPLMTIAIARGAISMLRLKNYRSAYTAAVLSVIPSAPPASSSASPSASGPLSCYTAPK